MPDQKSVIEGLMDFSFKEFVTPRITKLLYALHLLAGLIFAVGAVLTGFRESTADGLLYLIIAVVGLFFWILYVRTCLEVLTVVFRLGENMARIADRAARE